ncbi:uncharacterized protein LOC26535089 [Drosophila yakuba]|uniref:Uncharacterized protein n=1 Tax=Drosophila yakuba TaxID=7245 RepID=A0A0R1DRR7_DROYA|nr:uncharacterized protein LOC26535089 [Drosophila yakuba]KRJ99852.1 uncharacterized protein Dyak_GE27908 [Drosophila yakuba]
MCLKPRTELVLDAIILIIAAPIAIGLESTEETLETYHKILIGGLSFAVLAAILLLIGVFSKKLFPLYAGMAIMLLVAVLLFTINVIEWTTGWKYEYIIYGVCFPVFLLYACFDAGRHALELKSSRD